MQLTIDIPEPLYRELETQAGMEHQSVADLLVKGAGRLLMHESGPRGAGRQRVQLPLITGGEPGPLLRNGANLNSIPFMTDGEIEELAGQ